MSNYSEIIHAIPTKKTVEHWNTTIQQNAYKNKSWFDSLTELQKKNLVELIAPVHYASVSHPELVRIFKEYKLDESQKTLDELLDFDSDLTTLKIKK